jgi:hypothetical protein
MKRDTGICNNILSRVSEFVGTNILDISQEAHYIVMLYEIIRFSNDYE